MLVVRVLQYIHKANPAEEHVYSVQTVLNCIA